MNPNQLKLESDEFTLSKSTSQLEALPLSSVLSTDWLQQQKLFLSLNKCAYISAMTGQDEFVKRLLKEDNKSQLLVYELVRISLLKKKAIKHSIDEQLLPYWFIFVQSEGIIMNMFETLAFHSDFLYSIDDKLTDLVDYCYSNVSGFFGENEPVNEDNQFESKFAKIFKLILQNSKVI
jgi:hypothetical protein